MLETKNYTYGDSSWGDLLTSFNGTSISYDTIGNPTSIGSDILTWQGRELTHFANFDCQSVYFNYNADGIRTRKTFNDAMNMYDYSIEYMLNGSQIIGEHYTYNDCEENYREYTVIYIYDETGSPIGLKYREPSYAEGVYDYYFFEKNLQGDIIAIFNTEGFKIGAYNYDAWGNFTIDSAAMGLEREIVYEINPFRYRGYYYDVETGWYYLQSRYYNPEWGRFLNSDSQMSGIGGDLKGYNLFAYCFNNPVNLDDFGGSWPNWSNLIKGSGWLAVGITAVCVGVSVLTCGVASPAMVAIAATTIGAGALTAVNGAAEVGEAFTGYNVVRDTVFSGDQNAYDTYANITATIAEVGTAICGGWMKKNSPRINAYKSIDSYNVKRKHLSSGGGDWSKFNTTSQTELRELGRETLKNTPMSSLIPNSSDSYAAIYNFGRIIGTSGQTSARLVFSTAGKIITFFPQ